MSKIMILGTWPADDLRRAFVDGAAWWEFHQTGATMWPSDRDMVESEAEKCFPGGRPNTVRYRARQGDTTITIDVSEDDLDCLRAAAELRKSEEFPVSRLVLAVVRAADDAIQQDVFYCPECGCDVEIMGHAENCDSPNRKHP